jgi:AcrR family transcriptional regulator
MTLTPDPDSPSARTRPGRPRQTGLDERLQAAVLRLLHDGGPAAVTMERVATTSGVAKTSIYRRHANRGELLTAALENAIGDPEVPDEGTTRDKIRFALERAWHQMADILGPGGLAAIVGNSDPEFTELFRSALRPYDDALVARIRDDSRAGLLRPDVDADGVVSLMLGAYLGELIRHGTVAPDRLDRCLELIGASFALPPERGSASSAHP